MKASSSRRILTTVVTIVEWLYIAFITIFFVLCKDPTQDDIYLWGGILILILLLKELLPQRYYNLYFVELPEILNQLHSEASDVLRMDLRVCYFIFSRWKHCLFIPGSCHIDLDDAEKKLKLKEGEGVAGYVYLFKKDGLLVDLETSDQEGYCPRLLERNVEIVNKNIRWIYAQKICSEERYYGILCLDSVKDSWGDKAADRETYAKMVRISQKYGRSLSYKYQKR